MANWPRTILPIEATWPLLPTGLVAPGQTGKAQLRTTSQVGWSWTETYGPLKRSNLTTQSFLATVQSYWRNQTPFQIDHRAKRTMLGAGGATVGTVNGGGQTGSSINTTGWTPNQSNTFRAGDLVVFGGAGIVYEVTADAGADGFGNILLFIDPPIFAGGSPSGGAAVNTNGNSSITFCCFIESLQMPKAGVNEFYLGLTIGFRELPP